MSVNKRNNGDLGVLVIQTMIRNGVSTIPRNFEVYYSVLSGTCPELKEAIFALGANPDQKDIDEVANRYFPERLGQSIVQKAQDDLGRQMRDIRDILNGDQNGIEEFSGAISNAAEQFKGETGIKPAISPEQAFEALSKLLDAANIRIESNNRTHREVDEKQNALELARKELDEYRRIANTDHLTQLQNRRAFDDMVNSIYVSPEPSTYSLIMFDVDHFKMVNDQYGHPFGDRILQLVAANIRANLRSDVFVARYGGEEFAVIMQGVQRPIVEKIADRLRMAIEQMPIRSSTSGKVYKNITISLGICMGSDADNAAELVQRADEAPYASKRSGRNRSTIWSDDLDQTTGGARKMYIEASGRQCA